MLSEWLSKEAEQTMAKTAAQQFGEELRALEHQTPVERWREKRAAGMQYVLPAAALGALPGAAIGAAAGAIGSERGERAEGAFRGSLLGAGAGAAAKGFRMATVKPERLDSTRNLVRGFADSLEKNDERILEAAWKKARPALEQPRSLLEEAGRAASISSPIAAGAGGYMAAKSRREKKKESAANDARERRYKGSLVGGTIGGALAGGLYGASRGAQAVGPAHAPLGAAIGAPLGAATGGAGGALGGHVYESEWGERHPIGRHAASFVLGGPAGYGGAAIGARLHGGREDEAKPPKDKKKEGEAKLRKALRKKAGIGALANNAALSSRMAPKVPQVAQVKAKKPLGFSAQGKPIWTGQAGAGQSVSIPNKPMVPTVSKPTAAGLAPSAPKTAPPAVVKPTSK